MSESSIQPVSSPNMSSPNMEAKIGTGIEETSEGTIGVYDVDGMATILIHNDEITPYDYVIDILGDLFMLSEEMADHIAWTAHTKGVAVVVVRPRAEAVKLVKVARGRARTIGYPLAFSIGRN